MSVSRDGQGPWGRRSRTSSGARSARRAARRWAGALDPRPVGPARGLAAHRGRCVRAARGRGVPGAASGCAAGVAERRRAEDGGRRRRWRPRAAARAVRPPPAPPDVSGFPGASGCAACARPCRRCRTPTSRYGDPGGRRTVAVGARRLPRARARGGGRARRGSWSPAATSRAGDRLPRARRPGVRRIAIENPSAPGAGPIAARAGLEPVPVPVDGPGSGSPRWRERAGAVVLTPAHQHPTGVVLRRGAPRRARRVAARHDAVAIEDDYDAEYRYDRAAVGALQGLDPDRVVYAGSATRRSRPRCDSAGWSFRPRCSTPSRDEKSSRTRHRPDRAARDAGFIAPRRARPPPAPDAALVPRAPRRHDRGGRATSSGRDGPGSPPACT